MKRIYARFGGRVSNEDNEIYKAYCRFGDRLEGGEWKSGSDASASLVPLPNRTLNTQRLVSVPELID